MKPLEKSFILSKVDHTLSNPKATWKEVQTICDQAIQFQTASVCISPIYVKQAAKYVHDQIPICTVIGFPNGVNTTQAKCFETKNALEDGATEIDMVIQPGLFANDDFDAVENEIKQIKEICNDKILKVIVETCLWNEEQKIKLCEIVSKSGANFIKTSTGFSTNGATKEDIALFAKHISPHVRIKAAGGIQSWEDAENFLSLGASRLGTSRLVKLALEK